MEISLLSYLNVKTNMAHILASDESDESDESIDYIAYRNVI